MRRLQKLGWRSEDTKTGMPSISSKPAPTGDRGFESYSLQRRVRCEPVSGGNSPSYVEKPRFSAGGRAGASGAVGRDAPDAATSGRRAVISLSGHIPVPHRQCCGQPNDSDGFEFGSGSGKTERGPLIVPGERQTSSIAITRGHVQQGK